jgi:DNA segregation ATPase FtsK/SpoIIIE-like protein
VARQLPGVRSARASRHTRSLLLTYDPGEITADALIDALMAALGLVAAEADDVGSMFLGARQLGVAVSRLVGGRHILIALLALGVGLWAGRALLRSKKLRLGWLPLLLLAYSLVRELRPGSPAPARQRRI